MISHQELVSSRAEKMLDKDCEVINREHHPKTCERSNKATRYKSHLKHMMLNREIPAKDHQARVKQ